MEKSNGPNNFWDVFSPALEVNEWVVVGGGTTQWTLLQAAFFQRLGALRANPNPQDYLNLLPDSKVTFAISASDSRWNIFRGIDVGNGIEIRRVGKDSDTYGLNIIGWLTDEHGFDEDLYGSIRRRLMSRWYCSSISRLPYECIICALFPRMPWWLTIDEFTVITDFTKGKVDGKVRSV